jgi:hypothetical protein
MLRTLNGGDEECPDPYFEYIGGWWSPCLYCGRLAWDHPQADPLQDLRNTIKAAEQNLPYHQFPPTMRNL